MHDVHTPIAHMLMCCSHVKYEDFDVSAQQGHAACLSQLLIRTKTVRKIETFLKYLFRKKKKEA